MHTCLSSQKLNNLKRLTKLKTLTNRTSIQLLLMLSNAHEVMTSHVFGSQNLPRHDGMLQSANHRSGTSRK